jgi:hypothetical protein
MTTDSPQNFNQPCMGQLPGFTLADATGYKRLKKLADSKFNLLMDIRQKEDKIRVIDEEVKTLYLQVYEEIKTLYLQVCREKGIGVEYQSGILDKVIPVEMRDDHGL